MCEQSHKPMGVFQEAFELRDSGVLTPDEERVLEGHLSWLKMHLKSPAVLRDDGHHRAIAWFHPRAKEPIRRVRAIIELLREYGVYVEQITTQSPGIVIYEDGWQVVAKPSRKRSRNPDESVG